MKKIESLNNAQKTVLQLEKEITAISNNLTKVKNKDHTTMKKIINNINFLLTKNGYDKNLYQKEINEESNENKKEEEKNKINKNYQYSSNNDDKNIDYFLILNKQKNNSSQRSNKSYFNRKCLSSSKINSNISEEKKFYYNYNNTKEYIPNKENNNRNKIINFSENLLNKGNMTYSKPRLLTEYSKRNSNNNISYKNNTFNKNNRGSTGQIKNVKYLTLNEKVNNSCKNSKHKKPSILSTLYYNYKDNTENNTFLKNNMLKENNNNKKAISFEQPEISNKQKDIRDFIYEKEEKKCSKYEYGKEVESTSKKNKKLIFDKKTKKNIKLNINNKNCYLNNKCNLNNNCNIGDFLYLKFEDEDLNKNSNTDKKIIRNEKDNYIFSYGNQNMKKINYVLNNNNNIEKNLNSWGNYKTQGNIRDNNNNFLRQNISKSLNSKNIIMNNSNIKKNKFKNNSNNDNDIGNDREKINTLLKMLEADNINDGIMKVNNLLNYEKDINRLKEIYSKNNNEKITIGKNGKWLSNIINNYKRNEKYKNFCQNIMIFYKIKNFEEFKTFIKALLNKNKKNKKDYSNGKIINGKLEDNNLDKNINKINKNKDNNSNLNKVNNLYIEENDKDNYSHNSEDIKFSNIQNLKIITDYMHTYY